MSGRIVLRFLRERGIGAELIEWMSHGRLCHVDAVLPPFDDQAGLLGARLDGGVRIRPWDYLHPEDALRVELAATEEQQQDCYRFLHEQLGKPYDTAAIAGFAAGPDWRDPGHWFCSELQGAALEEARWFSWPLATPMHRLTPADLLLALSARLRVPLPLWLR